VRLLRTLSFTLAACITLSVANATPLAVVNPGFEDSVIPAGTTISGRDTFCATFPPTHCEGFADGWFTTDHSSDSNGTLHPDSTMFFNNGTFNTFPTGIPEGLNVGYSNGTPFYQILSSTIQASTIYNLMFYAGARFDFENQGYFAELSADTGNGDWNGRTVLARTTNHSSNLPGFGSVNAPDAPTPFFNDWIPIDLTATVGAADPLIGKKLIITFGSPAVEATFDNVVLDAASTLPSNPTPEPGTIGMMLGGALGLLAWKRRSALHK